jgi:formimidoylglutamate deiminase
MSDATFPTIAGFCNSHSHAFQRLLRGHVQRRDPARRDTFWTWREKMYDLAGTLDLQGIEDASRLCFIECLEAGYTAVGEFHYLHHDRQGQAWSDPTAASRAVIRAARQAGIRITLLWTVYAQGGHTQSLGPEQSRFGVQSIDNVWREIDALMGTQDGEFVNLGIALHSVRAVPRAWMQPLASGARSRGLPIHAHVSEQRREVDECREQMGLSPVALLATEGVLGPNFTAVHATWLDDTDLTLLKDHNAIVCICPTTEGDLGDGIPRTAALHEAGIRICIGSDSHAIIDPFAELRALEYQARATTERRCVLVDETGHVAPALTAIGHTHGYASLGLSAEGDAVTVNAKARVFDGNAEPMGTLMTAGHPGIIDQVRVGGELRVREGRWLEG